MKFLLSTFNVLFLTVLLAYIISSSISKYTNSPVYIDREFSHFFNEFNEEAKRYNVIPDYHKLTITFSNSMPPKAIGFCIPFSNTIMISPKSWQTLSTNSKKLLLFHELGHCTLKRDHAVATFFSPMLCPVSIMYPYITPIERCFSALKESYIRELFTNPYNLPIIRGDSE